jgi:hypothetical protein
MAAAGAAAAPPAAAQQEEFRVEFLTDGEPVADGDAPLRPGITAAVRAPDLEARGGTVYWELHWFKPDGAVHSRIRGRIPPRAATNFESGYRITPGPPPAVGYHASSSPDRAEFILGAPGHSFRITAYWEDGNGNTSRTYEQTYRLQ